MKRIGLVLAGLLLAGVLYEHFAERRDRTRYAQIGRSVDIGGRPFYEGPLPSGLYDHWMRSFSNEARATIHVVVLRGRDRHHVVEAAFKALGLALRDALVDTGDTVSTKGAVALSVDRPR